MRRTSSVATSIAFSLSLSLSLLCCGGPHLPQPATEPTADGGDGGARDRIEASIRFLADDLLEGRGTPSPELDIAALYLANQLRAYGWQPAAGDSYLQTYSVASYTPTPSSATVSIGGTRLASADFVFVNLGIDPSLTPIHYDAVFVGHGVVAPDRGIDELAGAELRGKAVVAIAGAPWNSDPTDPFGPEHWVGKGVEATVHNGALLVYAVDDLDAAAPSGETGIARDFAATPAAYLPELHGKPSMGQGPAVFISKAAFDRTLAKAAGGTFAEWQDKLATTGAKPQALSVAVDLRIEAQPVVSAASNVVAMLRGSDPALRDEWVVLTAHYDHLGTKVVKTGEDGIFNGADDNASGTAAILEIARRLATGPAPRRSVLVLLTSGEERGLLGSAHYAENPLVPTDHVVLDVNVDMVGRSQGMVQGIAETSKELFDKTVAIGAAHSLTVQPDQQPTWRILYLSDDYHFARLGVPTIEFFTGLHPDYHQPSDEVGKIRFAELGRIVDVIGDLTSAYAQGAPRLHYARPVWFVTPD